MAYPMVQHMGSTSYRLFLQLSKLLVMIMCGTTEPRESEGESGNERETERRGDGVICFKNIYMTGLLNKNIHCPPL